MKIVWRSANGKVIREWDGDRWEIAKDSWGYLAVYEKPHDREGRIKDVVFFCNRRRIFNYGKKRMVKK